MTTATGRGRSRARLSLPAVLDAAAGLVEREGARALSLRRLGRDMGVEAMSLYRYVANFDDLVDNLVNRVVDEMLGRPEMQPLPGDDWRAFLIRQAHGVRSIATTSPELFPLIATHPPQAPWIRPPLRSLRWIEEFLSGLLARGFAEDGAAVAYRAFTSFLLGHLLLEVQAHGVDTGPVEQNTRWAPSAPLDARVQLTAYPAVSRMASRLTGTDMTAEFQAALTGLLDRMEHLSALPSPAGLGT